MKVLFAGMLTVLLITGIGGCSKCSDGYYLDINQMQASAIRMNQFGNLENIKEGISLPFDSVFIQATFSGEYYGLNDQPSSLNFLPAALASDDCPGLQGTKEAIEKITVIALTDFDANFKANDTINSLVEANGYFKTEYGYGSYTDLRSYVAENPPGLFFTSGANGGFFLRLKKKPTGKIIKLRVEVDFINGEKYAAETIPITINQ